MSYSTEGPTTDFRYHRAISSPMEEETFPTLWLKHVPLDRARSTWALPERASSKKNPLDVGVPTSSFLRLACLCGPWWLGKGYPTHMLSEPCIQVLFMRLPLEVHHLGLAMVKSYPELNFLQKFIYPRARVCSPAFVLARSVVSSMNRKTCTDLPR